MFGMLPRVSNSNVISPQNISENKPHPFASPRYTAKNGGKFSLQSGKRRQIHMARAVQSGRLSFALCPTGTTVAAAATRDPASSTAVLGPFHGSVIPDFLAFFFFFFLIHGFEYFLSSPSLSDKRSVVILSRSRLRRLSYHSLFCGHLANSVQLSCARSFYFER